MILVIDIGNSNVVGCLYNKEKFDNDSNWLELMRVKTDITKHYFHWLFDVNYYISEQSDNIDTIILCSVVPELNENIIRICKELFNITPFFVDYRAYKNLPIKIPQPRIIGADLVGNAFAGYNRSPGGCIIADFGTVLTFTTIHNNEIKGVTFVPGLRTAMRSLSDKTAQLPMINMEAPKHVIGKNTAEAINSGIFFGYSGLVDRIIERIFEEEKNELKVYSTGGLGGILLPYCKTKIEFDFHFTVDGIRQIYEYNVK